MKQQWKGWLPHGVAWAVALVAVLLLLLLTRQVVQSESQVVEQSARRELSNLSRLSEEHASRTLHAADLMLQLIRVLYLRDGTALDLGALTRHGAIDSGVFLQVGVIDAQGIYRLSNLPVTPYVNLVDREHFRVHTERTADALFVSKPVLGRVSNKWTIQLTRRITRSDASFAGVVVVSVDVDYFSNFYASLDLGASGAAAMVGRDGVVRARRSTQSSGIGLTLTNTPTLKMLTQGQTQGFFENASPIDQIARLYHFRQIPGYPLYVTVAFGLQDYRAQAQAAVQLDWTLAALGSVLLLGFAALFSWHRVREQSQHRTLAASHEQMNLALDGGGLGLWSWDIVSGRFEADERLVKMLGFEPGKVSLTNTFFASLLHPDDWNALRAALPRVLKGEVPRLLLEHRLRDKDGHWVYLMARGQVTVRDASGRAQRMAGTDENRTEQKRLEVEAQRSQVLLKNMTDHVPAELFQFKVHADGHSCFPFVSKHFLDFYGLTLEQVQSDAALVFAWRHPDDAAMIKQSITETVTRLIPWQQEYRLMLPDGSVRWRSGHATPQKLDDGSVVCYGAIFDITGRKLAEEKQRVAAVAFDSTSPMAVSDANQVILRVNQAFVELTGYAADDVVGQRSSVLKSGRHDAGFYTAMWASINQTGHWEGEIWNRRKCGEVFLDWLSISVVKDPQDVVTHYVSVHTDITLRKRTEEDIRKLAFFDPLTQLPNRRLLMDRLQQLSTARARNNQMAAILFIDLDRFKQLNDTHGHDQGDGLLVQVAQRLQSCLREVDTVARLGGDEFVVALAQLGENAPQAQAGALSVAQKILGALSEPFILSGTTWQLSASIGVGVLQDSQVLPEALLRQADEAMYDAKAAGRNTVRVWGASIQ